MQWLSCRILSLMGWQFVGSLPTEPKFVVVGFPHTSNWDFFLFLGALHHFDIGVRFLAKDGLFRGPIGWLMRRWGGIPVVRSESGALVDTAVRAFAEHEEMILVIAPEGTRGRTGEWKSGFWRIADAADVPVLMSFIDAKTKRLGFGPSGRIGGDPDAWIASAAEFYADKEGLKPAHQGPVSL